MFETYPELSTSKWAYFNASSDVKESEDTENLLKYVETLSKIHKDESHVLYVYVETTRGSIFETEDVYQSDEGVYTECIDSTPSFRYIVLSDKDETIRLLENKDRQLKDLRIENESGSFDMYDYHRDTEVFFGRTYKIFDIKTKENKEEDILKLLKNP